MRAVILLFLALWFGAPAASAQAPAPLPEATAAPEKPAPKIPAKSVSADKPVLAEGFMEKDFTRILLHTGKASAFETGVKDGALTLTFDAPMKVETTQLMKTLKDIITGFHVSADGKTLTFLLKNPDVTLRRFTGTDFVGVDIVQKGQPAQTASAQPAAATAPVSIVPNAVKPQIPSAPKPRSILPQMAAPQPAGQQQQQAVNTKQPVLIPTFKEAIPSFPWLDPSQHKPKPRQVAKTAAPASAVEPEEGTEVTAGAETGATAEQKEAPEGDKNTLLIGRENIDKGIQLTFPWTLETAAAVFARGQTLWAVFNTPIKLDAANIKGIKYIEGITQVANKQYTILRIRIPAAYRIGREGTGETPLTLYATKEDYTWSISLQEDAAFTGSAMDNPLTAESGIRDGRPAVFLSINEASEPLLINDAEVGDQLAVIPLARPETGIAPAYQYVDFTLPQTAQGIVIRKISDSVSYRVLQNGIEISSVEQLSLSPDLFKASDTSQQQKQGDRVKKIVLPSQSVFPFDPRKLKAAPKKEEAESETKEDEDAKEETEEEKKPEEEEKPEEAAAPAVEEKPFLERRDELYSRLTQAADDKKSDRRLDIAKFFFQQGLYPESLGVLREIKVLDPIYANMYDVDLLVAADNYLLGRYTESVDQFQKLAGEAKGLASYDELRLWEWASRYKLTKGEHQENTEDMPVDYIASYDKFMQQYPEELRYAFGLLAIEAKIERKETENAELVLQVISGDIPPVYENDTKFLEGMLANEKGNPDDAAAIWEPLSKEVDDRFNRARATFELTKLRLIHGQISVDEAVETFSQLSVVWRGDSFELDVLKLVGQLYIREGDYLQGLRAWNVLVQNFPETKEAIYIAGKMKKIFVDLFDQGQAYKLPPKDALALYFEFRDLTPVGERGDRIIQQLADHFIKADLLDNAAALLQHQIEYRTQGKKKNELVLKLGELQLSNKKPQKTLEAITLIDKGAADEATLASVKYLRARAELAMEQYTTVLDTLQDDFSEQAQNIRLEVFWHMQNWFGIINIIEKRLDAMRETGPFPLKGQEIEDIVKLSVAYGTQEERDKLRMLKRDFADRIDSEKLQHIFGFVTNDIPSINYRHFDETVQLKEIENFMNEYAFWPGKDWQNVANVLAPEVEQIRATGTAPTREQEKEVVRLGIAYAMLTLSSDKNQAAEAEKALSRLNRDFRAVTVNRNTLEVFAVLDDKFIKKSDDAVFEGAVQLRDIPAFVEQYQAAHSISELNAVVKR